MLQILLFEVFEQILRHWIHWKKSKPIGAWRVWRGFTVGYLGDSVFAIAIDFGSCFGCFNGYMGDSSLYFNDLVFVCRVGLQS